MRRLGCIAALAASLSAAPAGAQVDAPEPSDEEILALVPEDDGEGEVVEIIDRAPPGSAHAVDAADLERFEHDDIHKVLHAVPGVYIRQEDGYGLRPNIGMRGTGSERSSKIALMEDGVLIAPAPYSAPAAYYFPLVTRMQRVEVVKGPAAIKHGPNTVGGAVNLMTRPIPTDRTITLDLAGGAHMYGKAHASYGDSTEHFGWLVEGVNLRTDGFKELDGGGDTGFDKREVMLKGRANTDPYALVYHQVDLKLGYADEVSDETYTGLTDADFRANPYRRYAGTQLDRMDWTHYQTQLGYVVRWNGKLELTTRAYRNDFARDWRKLSGFTGASVEDVLAAPDTPRNAVYYDLLTGARDSATEGVYLILGTNSRAFVSQGVQTTARMERGWLGWTHSLELGTRLHFDRVDRYHFEDDYEMSGGSLTMATAGATDVTRDTRSSSLAWATYYHHKVERGPWILSAGLRTEAIALEHRDVMTPADNADDSYVIAIPGGGLVFRATPQLELLAGAHRGFAPVSPGPLVGVKPETSVNYEAGGRWTDGWGAVEAIGFFSNYTNLLGTCTFSTGCATDQIDQQYNGGRSWAYGLELLASGDVHVGSVGLPWKVSYTLQRAEFRTSFDSDNPQWGDVEPGDELPYLPRHQLHVQLGAETARWEVFATGHYESAMRNTAGQGTPAPDDRTDSALLLGLAAAYSFDSWGAAYLTVDNLLDEAYIASRRPYGPRPGSPRLIVVGYKNTF